MEGSFGGEHLEKGKKAALNSNNGNEDIQVHVVAMQLLEAGAVSVRDLSDTPQMQLLKSKG